MHKQVNFRITFVFILILSLGYFGCGNPESGEMKQSVLLADREAPLGWVYLKLYKDKSFEFILQGLREETIYPGTYRLIKDTLFFTYKDSIPKAGKTAIISKNSVLYIDGNYHESVEIKMNKLTE